MKIYSMKVLLINDNNPYKNLVASNPIKYANITLDEITRGVTLEMKWAVDSASKPIGDFIRVPGLKFACTHKTIEKLKKFAPDNTISQITIDGNAANFSVLQPKNHAIDDNKLEHIFMMFSQYKSLLVTQLVKDEWERLGLTGAVFKEVAEMEDERFIAVE